MLSFLKCVKIVKMIVAVFAASVGINLKREKTALSIAVFLS